VHCLPAADRFSPTDIVADCSFASFAPDGARLALATPRGIEIVNRDDGSRVTATPPGFTLSGSAWHPDGSVLLASGPAGDGSGPYLHSISSAGVIRLLPDHPGEARAACFSPDGRKVAFTYLNRYVHQLCMADWTGSALGDPRNLLPVDPVTDPNLDRVLSGLAWYETRAFSANGRRLYFASDRGAGMLNVSIHYIDLRTGNRARVTYDEGVAEGAVFAPDNRVLYTSTTRARDPAFLTMVSGPAVPPLLGFVAMPTLHDQLAAKRLALIGNGDVLRLDSTYGLHARIVGNRKRLAKKVNAPVEGGTYRVVACSMSPDGTELAVAMTSAVGSNVVILERSPRAIAPAVRVRSTPTSPGSIPLSQNPIGSVDRTIPSERGGSVRLRLDGTVASGSFQMDLSNFSSDGVFVFAGSTAFATGAGGFRHTADVRRVNVEQEDEETTFYRADMQVDWRGAGGAEPPDTGGTLAGRSRSSNDAAAWDGATFAPQGRWKAGNRGARPVPGAGRCRRG